MKNTRQLLFLILALGIVAGSCTKIKESPEPSSSSGGTGGGGGGGGGGGNPAVYVGLWKLQERKHNGNSVFASLDTIPQVHLQAGANATWNYYVGNNVAKSENDLYSLNTSSNPAFIIFNTKGSREIVLKTGSTMSWKFTDPNFPGEEIFEEYKKQ